jgi:hypothetical protein
VNVEFAVSIGNDVRFGIIGRFANAINRHNQRHTITLTKEDVGPIKQIGSVGVFTFTSTQMEGTWHDH